MKQFLCIAFVTGMAVTTIELAAVRLLAPYFGASLFVWTNVIGVILLGLALGYVVGGRIADRRPELRLLLWCIGSAGVAVGIAPFVVKMIAPFAIVEGIFTRTFFLILVVGSFIAASLLFFLPVFLLAMTSPFLIRLASDRQSITVGTISGRIFGWSTVGSIVGVFLTGLLFIPLFGTRATFFGTAVVLIGLSTLGDRRLRLPLFILLALCTGFLSYTGLPPLRRDAHLLFERESPYQYIRVREEGGSRYLVFNEGNSPQSVWHPNTIATELYYDYLTPLPLLFPLEKPLRVLLLGLGGGTIPKQYESLYADRPYTIDAVEIDPVVVDVARRFFVLPENHVRVHVADGRSFLAATTSEYDVIILDAFAQQYYIPWHLTTREFFATVRERLAPNGIVVFNVDAARRESPLLRAIVRTVQEVFPHVATVPMPNSWNQIVFAKDTPIVFEGSLNNPFLQKSITYLQENVHEEQKTDGMILTDNRAPVEMMTDIMFTQEALLR